MPDVANTKSVDPEAQWRTPLLKPRGECQEKNARTERTSPRAEKEEPEKSARRRTTEAKQDPA
jgi:hypothetical protein